MQSCRLDKLYLRHRDGSVPVQASRGRQAMRPMYGEYTRFTHHPSNESSSLKSCSSGCVRKGWVLGLADGSWMRPLRMRPDRGAQLFLPRSRGPVLLQARRRRDALRHVSGRLLRILLERVPRYRSRNNEEKENWNRDPIILQPATRAYVRATSATPTQVAACARPSPSASTATAAGPAPGTWWRGLGAGRAPAPSAPRSPTATTGDNALAE